MKLWLDAQLSPQLAGWLTSTFELDATAICDLGLRDSTDDEIFHAAHEAEAVVVTKDADFVTLLERHGPPPQVIWVTCGNTSNARMREILAALLADALSMLEEGEPLVEIGERPANS